MLNLTLTSFHHFDATVTYMVVMVTIQVVSLVVENNQKLMFPRFL